ncbi:hypothetical protein [Streptomyces sp. NPDC097619]|uniref:hypothetical protein n=1 Tax=Streptomyces sp. NPDC097619 TaxID=3157228 RepID=UPI003316F4DD
MAGMVLAFVGMSGAADATGSEAAAFPLAGVTFGGGVGETAVTRVPYLGGVSEYGPRPERVTLRLPEGTRVAEYDGKQYFASEEYTCGNPGETTFTCDLTRNETYFLLAIDRAVPGATGEATVVMAPGDTVPHNDRAPIRLRLTGIPDTSFSGHGPVAAVAATAALALAATAAFLRRRARTAPGDA